VTRNVLTALAVAGVLLGVPAPAQAQEDYEAGSVDNYALSLGLGLVDPEGATEPYYAAALRIRLGDHDRSREDLRDEGIHGYIEPEIGYWSRDSANQDLLVGANLIGVVPFRRVDYTFGVGAGIHFLDFTLRDRDVVIEESEEALGVNAQFGIDVHLSESTALFGVGRIDLVEGDVHELQNKVYLGVRFFF
jgi:hypothetical protein